ncbi:MAG: hypothetical protein AAFY99_15390 [Pseudomonadota bacterium]
MRFSNGETLSLRQPIALLIVALAAILVRSSTALHPDVSWLLTLNERLLADEKLYVDLLVVNPVVPVWFYRLPVLIAQFTGMRAEWVLQLMIAGTALASFLIMSRLLTEARLVSKNQIIWLGVILFALLYVVSAFTFAQREFIGLLGFLPWLTLQAWRIENPGQRPSWPILVLCGVGCAALVLVKPYYVLTVLAPVVALCIQKRSIRPAFYFENLIGGAITVALMALFIVLHPAFFGEMMLLILSAYAPHMTLVPLQFHSAALATMLIAIIICLPVRQWSPLGVLLATALIGHLAALWIMGRAFPYHAYPAYVLGVLAIAEAYRSTPTDRKIGPFPAVVGLLCVGIAMAVFSSGATTGSNLTSYLKANHEGESFMPLSNSMIDGHPLSRVTGLEFVAPAAFLSISTYGDQILRENTNLSDEAVDRITRAKRYEWDLWRAAIYQKKPQVIVIPQALATKKPDAYEAIWEAEGSEVPPAAFYEHQATIDTYDIYIRL